MLPSRSFKSAIPRWQSESAQGRTLNNLRPTLCVPVNLSQPTQARWLAHGCLDSCLDCLVGFGSFTVKNSDSSMG